MWNTVYSCPLLLGTLAILRVYNSQRKLRTFLNLFKTRTHSNRARTLCAYYGHIYVIFKRPLSSDQFNMRAPKFNNGNSNFQTARGKKKRNETEETACHERIRFVHRHTFNAKCVQCSATPSRTYTTRRSRLFYPLTHCCSLEQLSQKLHAALHTCPHGEEAYHTSFSYYILYKKKIFTFFFFSCKRVNSTHIAFKYKLFCIITPLWTQTCSMLFRKRKIRK